MEIANGFNQEYKQRECTLSYTWIANMIILASYAQYKLLLHLPVDLKKIGPRYVPSKYEPRLET
jgi:hypothetical protein